MKIAIQTLGCKVNQAESASMKGMLKEYDYEIVSNSENPDICIINTCTVTAKSDYQSRQLIRRAVKSGAKVVATGCYAQMRSDELSGIEGLDLVIGNSGKNKLPDYINKLSLNGGKKPSVFIDSTPEPLSYKPYYSRRSRAFLKIQDGCNSSCSYCTVPLARGKSRSLNEKDFFISVEKLVSTGYREVVLTGIHIGSFGKDLFPESSLINIIGKIAELHPQVRIRLSSIEPQEFRNEYLEFIKNGTICSHLHIPLQSGSDKILKAMNRGYTVNFYAQLLNNIFTQSPGISIGTDIIAGFPGESEKDFDETVKLIEQLPLSYFHVFPYSSRPNTGASLLTNQVDDKTIRERVGKLLKIAKNLKYAYYMDNLNCKLNVIIEHKIPNTSIYKGLSENYLRILVHSDRLKKGQLARVYTTSFTEKGLNAKLLE